jgi:hypothetical protein
MQLITGIKIEFVTSKTVIICAISCDFDNLIQFKYKMWLVKWR